MLSQVNNFKSATIDGIEFDHNHVGNFGRNIFPDKIKLKDSVNTYFNTCYETIHLVKDKNQLLTIVFPYSAQRTRRVSRDSSH